MAEILRDFVGKYRLSKSENFDEFMKRLGVNYILRRIGNAVVNTVEIIEEEDGYWLMKNDSTFKHLQVRFRLGEPVEEVTPDGRVVLTTFRIDGDKFVQFQRATKKGEKDTTITRELNGDELITTCVCEDVVCIRTLTRVH